MINPTVRIDGDDDWSLSRRGVDGELQLKIVRWSARLERLLEESEVPHIIQGGSWEDGPSVLPKLVHFAPRLRSLITTKDPVGDPSLIGEFVLLEELTLQHRDTGIPYERLNALRELRLWDAASVGRAALATRLEFLQLWSLKLKDLQTIAGMTSLKRLMLTQMASLHELTGIDTLPLSHLTITNCGRLKSLGLVGQVTTLSSLMIDGTSRAKHIDAISALDRLEVLQVENGPALPTLDILGGMPDMQAIEIIGTEIGNGPCSVVPITGLQKLKRLTLAGRPRSLKNLTDIPSLGVLTTLEHLALDRVPDLPSLAWIHPLHALRYLAIRGTRVLDKDLSPVIELPQLTFLALDLRGFGPGGKTYSPSYEQVVAPSQARAAAQKGDVQQKARRDS